MFNHQMEKRFLSAYGYKWEYDIEGSTTIET